MTDFQTVRGFEDVWRPPVRPRRRTPEAILGSMSAGSGADVRAKLTRLASRAPEVMVKVTGRTRDQGGLRAHLDYISRNGQLELEDRDGAILTERTEVNELAADWSSTALADRRRRANSPITLSVMLSMPAGSDPIKVRDAARAFAVNVFAGEHDYVFALHTDTPRPHVHMAICSRGDSGQRLNPKKSDLEHWRQVFAQALRDRGVEAEATPRRARGVTRKAERGPVRRIGERHKRGEAPMAMVLQGAYREAARASFQNQNAKSIWEVKIIERQARIRSLYLAQAKLLQGAADRETRALGDRVEFFVKTMPQPDTQRLALARDLRAANHLISEQRRADGPERAR